MAAHGINNTTVTRFLKFWVAPLVCMGYIFYVSSLPGKDIPLLFPLQDVVFHGSIYGLLGCLYARLFKNTFRIISFWRLVWLTSAFAALYGVTDEFHQFFVPGRHATVADVFVDTMGGFLGSLVYQWLR